MGAGRAASFSLHDQLARSVVRACIIRNWLFPEGTRSGENVIWHLRVLNQCHKAVIVKEVLYYYWDNPFSTTHGYDNLDIYQD